MAGSKNNPNLIRTSHISKKNPPSIPRIPILIHSLIERFLERSKGGTLSLARSKHNPSLIRTSQISEKIPRPFHVSRALSVLPD